MDVQDDSEDSPNTSSISDDAPSMEGVVNNYEGSGSDPEDLMTTPLAELDNEDDNEELDNTALGVLQDFPIPDFITVLEGRWRSISTHPPHKNSENTPQRALDRMFFLSSRLSLLATISIIRG